MLESWPPKVRARVRALLVEVAKAPPYRHVGRGYWEVMHDEMEGFYEIRFNGPGRVHYRLFCVVDSTPEGADRPYLVVIDGATKGFGTTLAPREYRRIAALKDEYFAQNPRSVFAG